MISGVGRECDDELGVSVMMSWVGHECDDELSVA